MKYVVCFIIIALLSLPSTLLGVEIQGDISAEARLFLDSPAYVGQNHNNTSLSINTEIFKQINSKTSLTAKGFYRHDSTDSKRSHGDLRLCNLNYAEDQWQLTIGVEKVFWGVTEFVHLVDIINQTDQLEGIDGEEKLGQPMVHFGVERDWGTVDTYLLPYFRTRSFPGRNGRLRGPVVIEGSDAEFESGAEEHHLDFAIRYSHYFGGLDFGIYQFSGTSREPLLIDNGDGRIIPFYEQIDQTGIDLQITRKRWLWKLEAAYRSSNSDDGAATVLGFEYTLPALLETSSNISLIGEYVYDDRNIAENTLYNDDIMAGLRVVCNNMGSSELLAGLIWDTDNHSTAFSFEMSHRLSDFFKIELTGILLNQINNNDDAYIYNQDSFISLVGIYYF